MSKRSLFSENTFPVMNTFTPKILTVSEITAQVKNLIENQYRFVSIHGEISNLRTPFSGHSYFTLKDATAQIRAVLFKGNQRYLATPLREGQQVICRGRLSIYEQRGEYQIIVDTVDQHGAGMLQIQFEELKQRLRKEGLFAQQRKKPLPSFPQKVVVISSPSGAAIHDFLKIHKLRASSVDVHIVPTAVQGDAAGAAIARAVTMVDTAVPCDIIVLCRGGGAREDLWAFNEECLARAIAQAQTPVVTGIGHETDYTIADFCADHRAATPTGAAEAIFTDSAALQQHIQRLRGALTRAIKIQCDIAQAHLAQQTRHLRNGLSRIENAAVRLDATIERFKMTATAVPERRQTHLNKILLRLKQQTPQNRIALQEQHIAYLKNSLIKTIGDMLRRKEEKLQANITLLESVGPLATLARGYSIVLLEDGTILTDNTQANPGDQISIRLHQGRLSCEVLHSKTEEDSSSS